MAPLILIMKNPQLEIEPGGSVACELTVHNTSTIVEHFSVSVIGEAAEWATIEPDSFSLFPNTQHDVTVTFTAPRQWHIAPGAMPFGVMATPANDASGSVVEEGVLAVAPYRQITAELLPQVTMGKRRGKLGIAIDSRGNVPVPASIRGRDPSDSLQISVRPRNVVLEPGTTTFAKLKIVPRRRYLRGPQKQSRFKVAVEPEDGDPILLDATMLQQALLPKGSLVALGALALLGVWFLVIRPAAKNAALSAVQPQLTNQQKQQAALHQQLAATSKKVTQVQKKVNQSTTTTAATHGGGATTSTTTAGSSTTTTTTAGGTTTTTVAGSSTTTSSTTTTLAPSAAQLTPGPYSNAIEVVAAPGQVQQGTFSVPTGNELDLTDIIIENLTQVSGSTVQVGIEAPNSHTPKYFFEMSLEQLASEDFSLKTPLVLRQGYTLVIAVSCAGEGTSSSAANVYYDGTAQLGSG